MTPSKSIAALLGPIMIAVAATVLVNYSVWAAFVVGAALDSALVYLTGLLLLTAGVAIIRAHNVWRRQWSVVITALGWFFAVAGLGRMFFPVTVAELAIRAVDNVAVPFAVAVVILGLGAFLSVKGYSKGVLTFAKDTGRRAA